MVYLLVFRVGRRNTEQGQKEWPRASIRSDWWSWLPKWVLSSSFLPVQFHTSPFARQLTQAPFVQVKNEGYMLWIQKEQNKDFFLWELCSFTAFWTTIKFPDACPARFCLHLAKPCSPVSSSVLSCLWINRPYWILIQINHKAQSYQKEIHGFNLVPTFIPGQRSWVKHKSITDV